MSNLLKNIFGLKNKQLTVEEITKNWNSSNKSIQDAENILVNLPDEYIIQNLYMIDIKNQKEFNQLINLLKRRENKQIYNKIIIYSEFLNEIFIDINYFNYHYLFINKYELLKSVLQKVNCKEILLKLYFKEGNYMDGIIYSIYKKDIELLTFFIDIDIKKLSYLKLNDNKISKCFEKIFIKEEIESRTLNKEIDLLFNILIRLDSIGLNSKDIFKIIRNKNETNLLTDEEICSLKSFSDLYILYKEISDDDINMISFSNNDISKLFNRNSIIKYSEMNNDSFTEVANKLFDIINSSKSIFIYNYMNTLPYYILKILISERLPIIKLSSFVSTWISKDYSEKDTIYKFILKILIEEFSDSYDKNIIILEILKSLKDFKNSELINDLSIKLELLEILFKNRIKITLIDIIKSEYLIMSNKISFKESKINQSIQEYIKSAKTQYKFLEKSINSFKLILTYLDKFEVNFNDLYSQFLYNDNHNLIIRLFNENINFFKNIEIDYEKIINIFLSVKLNLKEDKHLRELISDINTFLKEYELDKSLEFKLKNLQRFINISSVFSKNQIEIEINEFDYNKLNIGDILEIFILKKFNIDNIISIDDFINKTNDIYKALDIDINEYIYNLFSFFFKYQKDKLYTEILNQFAENYKFFETLIIKMRKNKNFNINKFLNENVSLKLRILENTDNYEILEDSINLYEDNNPKIKFNIENEDVFSLYDLNLNFREIISIQGSNFQEKFINFISLVNNINNSEKKSTYIYSIHPKLSEALKSLNIHLIKEYEFNTKLVKKYRIYKLLMKKGKCLIDDILVWENVSKDDELNTMKILCNIYCKETLDIINKSIPNIDNVIINELIIYNITHLRTFNFNQYMFLKRVSDFKLNKEEIFCLLDKISNYKINLLPFLNNYDNLSKEIKEEVYKMNSNIANNVIYFNNLSERDKLINVQIYKVININNFVNVLKICSLLELNVNPKLLLMIKLCILFPNISCVINTSKTIEIIKILKSFKFSSNELKILSKELFNLPTLSFIFESHMNIQILEKPYNIIIQDFITSKLILIEDIISNSELYSSPLIINNLKIIKIKHHCIQNCDGDTIELYNNIRLYNDYSEFENHFKKDERIKKQIFNLYTN